MEKKVIFYRSFNSVCKQSLPDRAVYDASVTSYIHLVLQNTVIMYICHFLTIDNPLKYLLPVYYSADLQSFCI